MCRGGPIPSLQVCVKVSLESVIGTEKYIFASTIRGPLVVVFDKDTFFNRHTPRYVETLSVSASESYSLAATKESLYVSTKRSLLVYDMIQRDVVQTIPLRSESITEIAIAENILLLVNAKEGIRALDLSNLSKEKWNLSCNEWQHRPRALCVDRGEIYVTEHTGSTIRVLNVEGEFLRSWDVAKTPLTSICAQDGLIYGVHHRWHDLYVFKGTTGKLVDRYQLPAQSVLNRIRTRIGEGHLDHRPPNRKAF